MKKLLSLVLAGMMLCGLFVPGVFAEEEKSLVSGLYHYVINDDGTAEIISVDVSITDGNIPSELDGHKVTAIGPHAFHHCDKLTKVVIPEGVKYLEYGALDYCFQLETICIPDSLEKTAGQFTAYSDKLKTIEVSQDHPVLKVEDGMLIEKQMMSLLCTLEREQTGTLTIPQGIRSIANAALKDSQYSSIILPDSLTMIDSHAFMDCYNLKEIVIPEGVTEICTGAFVFCEQLESVQLPLSLNKVGYGIFGSCNSLKTIMISPDHPAYEMIDLLFVDKRKKEIVNALTSVPARYEIPEGIKGIAGTAFTGCESLTELIVPEGVTSIGHNVFMLCPNLRKITLPASVEEIGWSAFPTSGQVVIVAPEGSYAQEYCKENGYEFEGMKNEE